MDVDVATRYRTKYRGLRFADIKVEREYRSWYVELAVPFTRLGMIASAANWIGVLLAGGLVKGWQAQFAPWLLGLMLPVLAAAYVVTIPRQLRRWVLPATAGSNLVAGLIYALPLGSWITHEPLVVSLGTGAVAFFALAVFRLHPGSGLAAASLYVIVAQVMLLRDFAGTRSTTLFVASLGPWLCLASGAVVSVATEHVTRRRFQTEQIIEAQAEMINTERRRSDDLLRNILPSPVADRLKDGPSVIADDFDEVTVVFADIVGFTPLAASVTASQLVGMLNEVFTSFDLLAAAYGVEKIKTIGDAYMAVSGLPTPRPDHAEAAADFALAMRDAMVASPLEIRVGLATGPAVAGVIGMHKFAYDLWGDTVNTAARMESHGIPGSIQVTTELCRLLASTHLFEDRGLVEVKGKGLISTHLLLGRSAVPPARKSDLVTSSGSGPA